MDKHTNALTDDVATNAMLAISMAIGAWPEGRVHKAAFKFLWPTRELCLRRWVSPEAALILAVECCELTHDAFNAGLEVLVRDGYASGVPWRADLMICATVNSGDDA